MTVTSPVKTLESELFVTDPLQPAPPAHSSLQDILIWSATSMKWVEVKMKELGVLNHPAYKLVCMLDYQVCVCARARACVCAWPVCLFASLRLSVFLSYSCLSRMPHFLLPFMYRVF